MKTPAVDRDWIGSHARPNGHRDKLCQQALASMRQGVAYRPCGACSGSVPSHSAGFCVRQLTSAFQRGIKVAEKSLVSDSGAWDAYRSENPLMLWTDAAK